MGIHTWNGRTPVWRGARESVSRSPVPRLIVRNSLVPTKRQSARLAGALLECGDGLFRLEFAHDALHGGVAFEHGTLDVDAGPLADGAYTLIVAKEGQDYGKASIAFSPTAKGKVLLEPLE